MTVHLWLRAETKANEHRVALTPEYCKRLINEEAFTITVERSSERIFKDEEYQAVGCTLVDAVNAQDGNHSWKTLAPESAFIVGLKELPENDDSPLKHRHVFFGHAYKNQAGWKELLARFKKGNGQLLDLEFLNDEKGRRVAAFGYMAGFAGAAVGLDLWAHRTLTGENVYPSIRPYANDELLVKHLQLVLKKATESSGKVLPRALVIGALGRCGTGACDALIRSGIPKENIVRWDMEETKKGGPFPEILENDILINCIYLSSPIPPFLTTDLLRTESTNPHRLSVIVDVSCDTSNPHNPLPFYKETTTFDSPTLYLTDKAITSSPIDVVAIDHLPTLLPAESSTRFCQDLYPTIVKLKNIDTERVWTDVVQLFESKCASAGL